MKKILIIGFAISCAYLNLAAMMQESASIVRTLTFIKAQKGDDLSPYKDILLKVYPEYANNEQIKEYLKIALPRPFAVLASWIDHKKGFSFMKVHDGHQTPVGFLTLEALNEEETNIAFHQSPLLPEYLDNSEQYFECAKREFPHAQAIFAASSNKVTKMQALIISMGFVEEPSYLPSKDLVPNPEGFMGYKKLLNK